MHATPAGNLFAFIQGKSEMLKSFFSSSSHSLPTIPVTSLSYMNREVWNVKSLFSIKLNNSLLTTLAANLSHMTREECNVKSIFSITFSHSLPTTHAISLSYMNREVWNGKILLLYKTQSSLAYDTRYLSLVYEKTKSEMFKSFFSIKLFLRLRHSLLHSRIWRSEEWSV